ncbi:hypothetical protein [Paraburkholderia sp. 32]|uniref:hypothetical protein n=1 Tax=unclassified Paraburkholderia TaxID=2615204 RepID=UPI003D1FBC6C
MQQITSCFRYPDAGELKMLEGLVADTVSAAVVTGRSHEQFHGWEVQAWTSESRLVRRAHLRILYRNALWQQSDWILDWPRPNATVH